MSEMVDRVEKAMQEWDAAWGMGDDSAYWSKLARCAVLAMREPTKAMLEAGAPFEGADMIDAELDKAWQAMIEAALTGGK